jgi:hypothetical protein
MTKNNGLPEIPYELPWEPCLWLRTARNNWYVLKDGYARAFLKKKGSANPVAWVAKSRFHALAKLEGAQLFKGKIRSDGVNL